MTAETVEELQNFGAPYGRQIKLENVTFESGMRLLRVTIREGRRFTILDIDANAADQWGRAMTAWAEHNQSNPQT